MIGVLVAVMTPMIVAFARSDWPPLASIDRVELVNSSLIAARIDILWNSYCMAEAIKNTIASRAISARITELDTKYAKLNNGASIPILPCP